MAAPELLPRVEIDPPGPPRAAVIWLHGLGADGHDFEPLVPHLGLDDLSIRFVFPHAPRRAVTINMGMVMPAWYDIHSLSTPRGYDAAGIHESAAALSALIAAERQRGIPSERILLAGFSQGGVISLYTGLRHPEPLAGILALSTYLAEDDELPEAASEANRRIPIFLAHGLQDPMVPIVLSQQSRQRLEELGYPVQWHEYPMGHQVVPEEIRDLSAWLRDRLGP